MAKSALLIALALTLFFLISSPAYSRPISESPDAHIVSDTGEDDGSSLSSFPVTNCGYDQAILSHSAARFRWIQNQIDGERTMREASRKRAEEADLRNYNFQVLVMKAISGMNLDVVSDLGKRIVMTAWHWMQPPLNRSTEAHHSYALTLLEDIKPEAAQAKGLLLRIEEFIKRTIADAKKETEQRIEMPPGYHAAPYSKNYDEIHGGKFLSGIPFRNYNFQVVMKAVGGMNLDVVNNLGKRIVLTAWKWMQPPLNSSEGHYSYALTLLEDIKREAAHAKALLVRIQESIKRRLKRTTAEGKKETEPPYMRRTKMSPGYRATPYSKNYGESHGDEILSRIPFRLSIPVEPGTSRPLF